MANYKGSWDASALSPLQLRMIRDAIAARRNKDLGAVELAGLLRGNNSFIPVELMKGRDVSQKARDIAPRGSTFGMHWSGPNSRIAMNPSFPGNFGGTFGHELAHEAYGNYGFGGPRGGDRQHDLIGPYLAQNYTRRGAHKQVGPDVSRGGRAADPRLNWRSSIPASPQELGLPFTVKDIEGDLARSAEGRRRRAWWNANRNAIMRRMGPITCGRGR